MKPNRFKKWGLLALLQGVGLLGLAGSIKAGVVSGFGCTNENVLGAFIQLNEPVIEIDCPGPNPIVFTTPKTINAGQNITIFGKPQNFGAQQTVISGFDPGPMSSMGPLFHVEPGATLNLFNVKLKDASSTGNGGAIDNHGGTLNIGACVFENNRADLGSGGAIGSISEPTGGQVTVEASTFINNSAGRGGAIYFAPDTPEVLQIANSTFFNNTSGTRGGAILTDSQVATVFISSSTFADNGCAVPPMPDKTCDSGLTIAAMNDNGPGSANVRIQNTIITHSADDIHDHCYSVAGAIQSAFSLVHHPNVNPDNTCGIPTFTDDPQLQPLAFSAGALTPTMALIPQTPPVDHGNPAGCSRAPIGMPTLLDFDQRGNGFPRHVDADGDLLAQCDIGAYELEGCGDGKINGTEVCDGADVGVCMFGCEPVASMNQCNCSPPPPPVCGDNSINQATEECDDGNNINGDGCDLDCQNECGNGGVDTDNTDTNMYVEECDDSNNVNGDGCSATCQNECGNNMVDTMAPYTEQCDGMMGICPGSTCIPEGQANECTCLPACGDGILGNTPGEVCDDGNVTAGDGCSATCQNECGDGMVDMTMPYIEECDDSNNVNGDGCSATCQNECGDGVVDTTMPYVEQCDGMMGMCPGSTCIPEGQANACTCLPACGDGILGNTPGEVCDDGNVTVGDGCSATCQNECGNNVADTDASDPQMYTEQCDGNDDAACLGAACNANCTCQAPTCGNNVIEGNEQCDSQMLGNCANGCNPAGSANECQCSPPPPPTCGNNLIETGESCDGQMLGNCTNGCNGPNSANPCQCTPSQSQCGNNVIDAGEQCDGGPSAQCLSGCTANCTCATTPVICGDGVISGNEQCDNNNPGNCTQGCEPAGSANECRCSVPTSCGNNTIDVGEQCDGAALGTCGTLGCDINCTCNPKPAICGDGVLDASEQCDASRPEDADKICQTQKTDNVCIDCQCEPLVIEGAGGKGGTACSLNLASETNSWNLVFFGLVPAFFAIARRKRA